MSIAEISLADKKNFTNRVILSGILSDNAFTRRSQCLSTLELGNFKVSVRWNKGKKYHHLLGKHVMIQGKLTISKHYNDKLKKYSTNLAVQVDYMEVVYDI